MASRTAVVHPSKAVATAQCMYKTVQRDRQSCLGKCDPDIQQLPDIWLTRGGKKLGHMVVHPVTPESDGGARLG